MMQPRSPQSAGAADAPAATTAAMMEPARRKRKRPTPTTATPVATEKHVSGSETEEEEKTPQHPTALRRRMSRTSESDADERKSTTTTPTATTTTADAVASAGPPTRGPFRGKCLYQSRKCENERALKRNGKPHNLCDEHRNKQNQHQRKFDAKKYTRKKRKDSGSEDDGDDDHHEEEERQEASEETPAPTVKQEHKPSARGKNRAGAAKPKRGKISPASSVAAAVAAMPSLSSTSPTVADTAQYDSGYYRPVISPTHHDARPLEIRRPPALHVHRSSPPSMGLGLPPVHHIGSPPVPALGNVFPVDRRSPPYANRDMFPQPTVLVPPVTPVDHLRQPFPSPYGATAVYPFLRPPPPPARSRSFDSGVTRISPMGGAAPGAMGQQPFAQGHPMGNLTPDQSHTMPPSSSLGRPDKLPSLQQLPLGQLTRSRSQSHHVPFAQTYLAPTEHAYTRQSPPLHHQLALPRPGPQTAQLLPSLGPLPPLAAHRSPPSTTSPQQHQLQTPRGYHQQRPNHPY